jgi:asparagine synthase (glutamine-hydrolysing)
MYIILISKLFYICSFFINVIIQLMNKSKAVFSGCGITGLMLSEAKIVPEKMKVTFKLMLDSLKHRGPDGSGVYCSDNILLGHRRLSILDISEKGNQPMTRDHLTITLNGEIYNFQDIRKILQSDGFSFTSETDTEVVLRSYQKWGAEALHHFNGMFAFAIWDNKKKQFFIARDRLGIKPFYFYSDKHIFIFASEIEPLLLSGYIKPEVNLNAFEQQLFATSFFETDFSRTLIENIKSLPPGYYMNVDFNGSIHLTKYWDLPEQKFSDEIDDAQLQDELEVLFYDSIKLRMISDVPVSAFLSGGLDSSLINYFASGQTSEKLTSITISYADGGSDPFSDSEDLDLKYSKDFITQFNENIDHKLVSLSTSDISVESIDEIIDLSSISDDDRLLSIIKNYESVKKSGFKVVLNGQGADEIMGGYIGLSFFYSNIFDARYPEKEIINNMFPALTIPGKNILNSSSYKCCKKIYENVFEYYNTFSGTPAEKIHRFFTKTELHRILKFEDFLSMRHSVECRLPFLDYRIVEFAFKVPFKMHFLPELRSGKKMFRDIALKYLPESIATRPKQAFPVSRSQKKYQQLSKVFNDNKMEIINSDLIKKYFDISKYNCCETNISLSELWELIVIWRWEEKLKHMSRMVR